MSRDYDIRLAQLSPEDGGVFLAWVPDLPGCMSDGSTSAEAIQNATAAIDEWISEAVRLGRVVPAPGRKWAAN
jgi:antitoxin HicB